MQYVEEFLNYLKFEKRCSSHTQLSYQTDLKQFSNFVFDNNNCDNPQVIDHKMVRRWIVYLFDKGITARSINRKLTTLKTFFKYLLKTGIVTYNPLDKVIAPKTSKRLPVFVDEKQMDSLIDDVEFGNDFVGRRNKMIIELFYFTGIRLSELINCQLSNIDFYNQTIKVTGKRNKERIIPLNKDFSNSIKDFIEFKNESGFKNCDYLFCGKKGRKLYPEAIYRVINSYLKLVSSVDKKSPHVLRHTFATHMLNRGADLNAIKELLGHANLSATQIYTHNTFEKLTKIYKQAHPRA
jgi:integrase/recombinase XerC